MPSSITYAKMVLTSDNTLGYDSWYLLPFGRGSIKITSSDAYSSSFNIDPRYLSNDFDLLAQAGTARFTRTVSQSSPVARDVTGESAPGGSVGDNSLTSWGNWVKDHYRSNWHPIGTVAMMSQDMGGSVDPRNRLVRECVYLAFLPFASIMETYTQACC